MLFPTYATFGTFDLTDKDKICSNYTAYYLNRLISMFKYTNLPDSIPQKWLEMMLMISGNCAFVKHNDVMYATRGALSDELNAYYIPTKYIVTNPYIPLEKTFIIDQDCVVMFNDSCNMGIMQLVQRYATLMTENLVSMRVETINSRMSTIMAASDDNTRKSAEIYLKRIEEGKLGVIAENKLLDGINIQSARSNSSSNITNLIEMQQYLKASLYNELGLNANYNMKREAINSNESQLNDDMLTPLIDDMLRERQNALEKVNAMFGLDISVEFNSAWADNEEEHEAAIEELEASVDQIEAEADQAEAEADIAEIQAVMAEEAPEEVEADEAPAEDNEAEAEDTEDKAEDESDGEDDDKDA